MGFMAGFGSAFADSFNAGLERKARQREDRFKMGFQAYLDRKETENKQNAENAKNIKQTQALAEMYGITDPNAVKNLYDDVSSGLDQKTLDEKYQGGGFVQTDDASPVASPAQAPSVDQQMTDSGLSPDTAGDSSAGTGSTDVPAQDEAANAPGLSGVGTDDEYGNMIDEAGNQVDGDVGTMATPDTPEAASAMGEPNMPYENGEPATRRGLVYQRKPQPKNMKDYDTPQEAEFQLLQAERAYEADPSSTNEVRLQTAQDAIKAHELNEARKLRQEVTKASITSGNPTGAITLKQVDEQGNFDGVVVVKRDPNNPDKFVNWKTDQPVEGVPFAENEFDELNKLSGKMTQISEKHMEKATNVGTLLKSAKTMVDFGAKYPGSYAERTNALAKWTEDWANDLRQMGNLLTDGKEIQDFETRAKEIEDGINSKLNANISDAATISALREAQVQLFTYRLANSMGQSGRGLAEAERMVFEGLARAGNDPEAQKAALATIVNGQVRELGDTANTINTFNNDLRGFESVYGYRPFEVVPSLEQIMDADPAMKSAYETFEGRENKLPGDVNRPTSGTLSNGATYELIEEE